MKHQEILGINYDLEATLTNLNLKLENSNKHSQIREKMYEKAEKLIMAEMKKGNFNFNNKKNEENNFYQLIDNQATKEERDILFLIFKLEFQVI